MDNRTETVMVRMTKAEKRAAEAKAKAKGLSLSAWLRMLAAMAAVLLVVGCGGSSGGAPADNCFQFGHFTDRDFASLSQDDQARATAMCGCACQGNVAVVTIDTCEYLARITCSCPSAPNRVLNWEADACWQ